MASITNFITLTYITGHTRIMTIFALIKNHKVRSCIFGTGWVTIGSRFGAF